ncbi:hypothetical protein STEG23_025313, partial [Scotinomys teguina]
NTVGSFECAKHFLDTKNSEKQTQFRMNFTVLLSDSNGVVRVLEKSHSKEPSTYAISKNVYYLESEVHHFHMDAASVL